MRAIEPVFPSDAPCPGIDGLVLPARDRIISLASGWAGEVFVCLKPEGGWLESKKRPKGGLAAIGKILSVFPTRARFSD
jgi:hypothetical protein